MQDNDLPQIGTPMQTDETRAREVLAATVPISISSTWTAEEERQIIRAMLAFAAPPAVEREGDRWRFARYLNGVRMAEGIAVTLADDLDTAIAKAVKLCPKAPSGCQILVLTHAKPSPTLHPSDREAIARVVKGARLSSAFGREFKALGGRLEAVDLAAADAILALSGSLAPEGGGDLPNDVRRLVIAARGVAFDGDCSAEVLAELDAASESFADRVPWDDEPDGNDGDKS